MLLAIIDTETTGLNPEIHKVCEIGCILYSVENRCIIQQFSTLVPVATNDVTNINGITVQASQAAKPDFTVLMSMLEQCDFVVGHNIKFDMGFIKDWFYITKPTLCTLHDFVFPLAKAKSKKLTDIAIDHNIPVWKPHRALYDCQLIANIFDCYEDLSRLIQEAQEEKILYISLEDRPGTLSKAAGFRFNDEVKGNKWSKRMKQKDIGSLGFRVIEAVGVGTV